MGQSDVTCARPDPTIGPDITPKRRALAGDATGDGGMVDDGEG